MKIFDFIKERKYFDIIFPLYFILLITRTVEEIKYISNITPLFSIVFIILFNSYLEENKSLKVILILANLFSLWALLTMFWSSFPLITAERAVLFFITSNGIILGGYHYSKINKGKPLFYLLPVNLILLIVAVFSLITHLPTDYWSGPGFGLQSFWGHPNTLGSLIAFTLPGFFFMERASKKQNVIISVLLIINVFILILTHSRAAIAVTVLSVVLFALLTKDKKVIIPFILFIVLFSGYMLLDKGFYKTISLYTLKTESSLLQRKKPTILGSVEAAKEGNIIGLGYGISTPKVVFDSMPVARVVREKTVSILALIEETGVIGLLLFFGFILSALYFLIKRRSNTYYPKFLIAVIFAMIIHAQFEAWWVGVFSTQLPIFLAVLGTSVVSEHQVDLH